MTRSLTSWFRIEPVLEDGVPGPDRSLEARIYDPAWLLGRQWQLGELNGEDAASPAWVRLRMASAPITRLQLGGEAAARSLSGPELIEPLVEAEADQNADWASSMAAGAHFLAALVQARHAGLAPAFRRHFPLPDPEPPEGDVDARRRYRVLRRRGLDGAALLRAVRTESGEIVLPERPRVGEAAQPVVLEAIRRWAAWYPPPAPGAGAAWVPERLEHHFKVAAPDPRGEGEVIMDAPEYQGGRLDWHDLRVSGTEEDMGAAGDAGRSRWAHVSLPTRVRYPGMPANRWWEFEDAGVSFGHVEAEGGDLARLLLVEFATVFGNDWFLAPCDVGFGDVVAVEALVVVDNFGRATLVEPASPTGWRMFNPSGAPAGLLVIPAVVGATLNGPPIEEVQLARDETANMAWAIERRVSGPAGNPVDRHERWRDRLAANPPVAPALEDPETVVYRLSTGAPDHWIPLVPRADGHRSIRLHRGVVVDGTGREHPPQGRLLEPDRPLAFFEEEIPRSGLLATRSWQLARAADGDTVTWISRRVRPGRGESHSGLAFDRLTPQT